MLERKHWVFLSVLISGTFFDQLTKWLVRSRLSEGESVPVIGGFFNIVLAYNPGAAFNFLADAPPAFRDNFFLIVPVLALIFIFVSFQKLKAKQTFSIWGLSLIASGALGNLVDRVHMGKVTDFLDFHYVEQYHFPAFNVADSLINVGVVCLLLTIFFEKEDKSTA